MLFDTHAHYDDEAFDPDRREVLAGLPQKGVGLVVDPGLHADLLGEGRRIGGGVSPCIRRSGPAPGELPRLSAGADRALRQLARREKVVAIGESDWTTTGRRTRPVPCSRRCCGGSWRWRRS